MMHMHLLSKFIRLFVLKYLNTILVEILELNEVRFSHKKVIIDVQLDSWGVPAFGSLPGALCSTA